MNDQRLDELLRTLPPIRAEEGFTDGVFERLGSRRSPLSRSRPFIAAAAVITVLASVVLTHRVAERRDHARIETIRVEERRLAQDLENLKTTTETPRDIIYIGGDEQVGFVLNLTPSSEEVAVRPLNETDL